MNDRDLYFKEFFAPEFQNIFEEFVIAMHETEGDDTGYTKRVWKKFWNDGNLRDGEKSPMILVSAGDNVWYCWENGYTNTLALGKKFQELTEADKVRFLEDYSEEYLNW